MTWYTRGQLVLLLLLLATAGLGLGVVHWRAAHPELVERLERIDQEIALAAEPAREVGRAAESPAPRERTRPATDARPPARSQPPKRRLLPPDEAGSPLDLNHATLSDLTTLPGVGPVLAGRILAARAEVGRFATVDDLATVRGLGRTRLERIRPLVRVPE